MNKIGMIGEFTVAVGQTTGGWDWGVYNPEAWEFLGTPENCGTAASWDEATIEAIESARFFAGVTA